MSNIYIQEPPTNGKVLLKTSNGDIDIELWSKEAPKACRNFIQLCLEGYYDNSIFHRIIRGFIVQGGDPTGSGEGGQSVYGQPFKDEFHSRLKFSRRGLVAMANAGPNDNASQFFFTLDRCEHLNNKHTIFGKVTGHTVFNMLKLGDVETDGEDRPLYPPKIKTTEVLANPFDDIVPRETKKHKEDKEKKRKSKSKATKNFSLLSFGEEAEEDEEETIQASEKMRYKSKSAHDLAHDRTLSSAPAIEKKSPPQDAKRKRSVSGEESVLSSPESKSGEGLRQKLKKFKGEDDQPMQEGDGEDESVNMKKEAARTEENHQQKSDKNKPEDSKKIESDERTAKDRQKDEKNREERDRSNKVNDSNRTASERRSRWDKIPEKVPEPVVKMESRDQVSGSSAKKSSPNLDRTLDKNAKKDNRDADRTHERTSERSNERRTSERPRERSSERNAKRDVRGGGAERNVNKRDSRDAAKGTKRDSQEMGRSDRGAKREHRDLERPERGDRRDNSRDAVKSERGSKPDIRQSRDRKESRDVREPDRTEKGRRESRESSRSRSSSDTSGKKDSQNSDKLSDKSKRNGSEVERVPENGANKKKERRLSQEEKEQKLSRKEQIRRELESLNRELQETRRKREEKRKMEEDGVVINDKEASKNEVKKSPSAIVKPKPNSVLDEFHEQRKKFKQLKKHQVAKGEDREAQTLAILAKFQKRLHTAILEKPEEKEEGEADEEDDTPQEPKDEEEEEEGFNWALHSLRFEDHGPVLAKDANIEGADTFDIYDPRNPMNKRRREESKRKSREERKGRR